MGARQEWPDDPQEEDRSPLTAKARPKPQLADPENSRGANCPDGVRSWLQREVVPTSGCTEPGSVALAVARARELLEDHGPVDWVCVRVSDSIFKNGRDVGIPGVRGMCGNEAAAALAALGGRSLDGLQLLHGVLPETAAQALLWVKEGRVRIERCPQENGVYVEATVSSRGHEAVAVVRGEHWNVCPLRRDGVLVSQQDTLELEDPVRLPLRSFEEVYRSCDMMSHECRAHLLDGITMNLAASEAAIMKATGGELPLTHGLILLQQRDRVSQDLGYQIRIGCMAASEYRMSGGTLPIMSSGGSGNAGIVAILPIALAARDADIGESSIVRALGVSHLTNGYIKERIGRLAPICGCVVAAGAGAAAGLCKLHRASAEVAAESIRMLLSNSAGMFCDGAKESCALKVGTAAHEAFLAAHMAMSGARIQGPQGLADVSVDQTITNVARVNAEALRDLDDVLISVLESR
jgi:L-cysteine desulfidase